MYSIKQFISYLEDNNVTSDFHGSYETVISGYCPLNALKNGSITWIRNAEGYNLESLEAYDDMLVICNKTLVPENTKVNYIFTDNPHSVFFSLLDRFFITHDTNNNVIDSSSIVETDNIGNNVSIGRYCCIGKEVIIGDNVKIYNNVSIEGKITIGDNTVINSGVVIVMDGYAFFDDINGRHRRVPHPGGVIIGKNVEIGANTCIAKGCLGNTIICDNVKIDNLCHIGHNVVIGKNSKIIALSMLGGSSVIGDDVWVAPCAAIKNQVTVGDNSLVGMGAVVIKDVEPEAVVAGVPAKFIRKNP